MALASVVQAEVAFDDAWMRPAHAGQAQAAVYVDIRSSEALTLVGASTGVAKRVDLVANDRPGLEGFARVAPSLPLVANGVTRLAYLGSHLRLVDLLRDVRPGERVDVDLVLVDAAGQRRTARLTAQARGIAAPAAQTQPDPPR